MKRQVKMEFKKYYVKGAYHWVDMSLHPLKSNPFVRERYELCLKCLSARLPPKRSVRVLDLGCGDGALTYVLWRAGYSVVGLDTSVLGIQLAREMHKKKSTSCDFICGTVESIESEAFDAVICSDVIEHVPDPKELLRQLSRVMKQGGIAVLSTPIRISEAPLDSEHVVEWWPSQWRAMFDDYRDVEFVESHPVALMELMRIRHIKIFLSFISLIVNLSKRRDVWSIYGLQFCIFKK